MKNITLLIVILSMSSCTKKIYTSNEYFDCSITSDFKPDTDKKQLIYAILERALVSKKDMPDYLLISGKNKVYINSTYYPDLMGGSEMPEAIDQKEIPTQVNNVQLCIKSETELQEIANKTSDFLYLTLGNIEIDGDSAKIGLSNNWVVSKKNKGKYALMSGGGYILTYKKVNGKWIYDEEATHISWQA